MKVEGVLGYDGPDDPPLDYYFITTKDGKSLAIGYSPHEWGVESGDGLPDLPKDGVECTLEITVKKK